MSERGSCNGAIDVYLVDDVGDDSIDRVKKLLIGIPHGANKAISSAIKRASQSGLAYAAKVIRREYTINAGDFKTYTQSKRHFITSGGNTTVDIEFKGTHIPLKKFNTSIDGSGRIVTQVKRSSARAVLENAFFADVNGHEGVFERETSSRFPIKELFGPSTPQMMSYNDDISQEIGDKVRDTFEKRIDHEMLAVLNGWRK